MWLSPNFPWLSPSEYYVNPIEYVIEEEFLICKNKSIFLFIKKLKFGALFDEVHKTRLSKKKVSHMFTQIYQTTLVDLHILLSGGAASIAKFDTQ